MANKSFFGRLFSKESDADQEIKALQNRLDQVAGEAFDRDTYDAKFIEAEASSFSSHYMANFSGIDQIVDVAALQRVYASETWVFAAVNAIADTMSSLPLRLEKRREYQKTVFNDLLGAKETVLHEAWEAANGAKLNKLFQVPNPHSTRGEFISLLIVDLLTAGDYYIYLDSDQDLSALATAIEMDAEQGDNSPWSRLRSAMSNNTHIKGMYRIPPAMIKPVMDDKGAHVAGYVLQTDKGNHCFEAAEIIHVRLANPNDQLMGLSPLIPAFKSVLLDRFTTEHMIRFYKSGARLGGIIETDKALNKEQLGRFQRTFETNFTGRHNHHRTLILQPGMSYKQVEQNPAETALLEFCRYNREAILAVYRVPPIKLGVMENANYANARVQLKMFFTQTVKKYIDLVQDGFNNHPAMLVDNRSYRVQFDLSNVEELQEDLKEKAQAASEMLRAGATVNEVREAIWKKGPIDGGEDSPVIVEMEAKKNSGAPSLFQNLSAPIESNETKISSELGEGKVEAKEALPDAQADTARLSDVTPTTTTFSARVAQLVAAFVAGGVPISIAVPKAIEQATLEGFTDPDDDNPNGGAPKPTEGEAQEPKTEEGKELGTQPGDQGHDLVPTQIGGKPEKEPCAVCGKEECECGEKTGGKVSYAQFLSEEIAKLTDDTEITPELLADLKARYEAQGTVKEINYANGFTKDSVTEIWKNFISKTDPLVVKRHAELKKFFDKYKSIVMNRFGANLKSYGMYKARDNSDTDAILDPKAYEKLLQEYIASIDKSLEEAMQEGYADTLSQFNFGPADEDAKAALRKYALKSATSIDETTRNQLGSLLNEMFEQGKSVTEIGVAIRDKFDEIEMGRAMTIARTETLTAVSLGKAAKREEWQKRFPDQKLMKMWLSAKDDRVRDSHAELEGVSVPADEEFPNGLMYPRDPRGEAEEVINCRCDSIDYIEEDKELIEASLSES